MFANDNRLPATATGVEFAQSDDTGKIFTVFARKEVIVSAGAIQVVYHPDHHVLHTIYLPYRHQLFCSYRVLVTPSFSGSSEYQLLWT